MDTAPTKDCSEIEVSFIEGKSVLTTSKIFKPLKVFTLYHGNVCHLVFSNYGGGFVEGDSISIDLSLKAGTQTIFSNQANTRIYKSESKGASRHTLHAKVEEDAFVVYLGDPVIPHERSRFEQVSHWSLSKDAVLLSLEWFEAGRLLNGERFDFTNFFSEMKVELEGNTVAWDRFSIAPEQINVNSPASFFDQSCYLNIFLIGNESLPKVKMLEEHLRFLSEKYFHETSPELIQNAGLIGTLVKINSQVQVIRCASRTHETISGFVKELTQIFAEKELLGFNPFTRKF